MKKKML